MFKFVMTKKRKEILHRAVICNDIKRTRMFLEEALKDPRFNIDEVNEEGLTPLQYSTFAGNLDMMEILVNYGANWKIRDREGYTLLHAAAMGGHASIVRYLLKLGIKPVVKTDDKLMPIDLTEELTIIVILLRSMLDQGFLSEMQDYMLDHPKLKRNIFEELEKAKTIESKRNEVLGSLPYTSHNIRRKERPNRPDRPDRPLSRSLSTFYALSDSIQNLPSVYKIEDDDNNNGYYDTDTGEEHSSNHSENDPLDSYQSTQKYLESRYPIPQSKTVTFDLDVSYEDEDVTQPFQDKPKSRLSFSSSISTHSSNNGDVFTSTANPILKKPNRHNQYRFGNNHHLLEDRPPELPPRVPINYNSDRQMSSETDSGIDLNETAGRMFALSIDENPEFSTFKKETYSGPLGIYYNAKSNKPFVRLQNSYDDSFQQTFYTENKNRNDNVKYQSWNGTTLQARRHEGNLRYSFCRRSNEQINEDGNSDTRSASSSQFYDSKLSQFAHQPDIML